MIEIMGNLKCCHLNDNQEGHEVRVAGPFASVWMCDDCLKESREDNKVSMGCCTKIKKGE